MFHVSRYERELIAAELGPVETGHEQDVALFLAPDTLDFRQIAEVAVWPALAVSGFKPVLNLHAFDSNGWLKDVARAVRGAELLVADVTGPNPDVLYALGLCHGLGRCPLLISQNSIELPFHLQSLCRIDYENSAAGLRHLREDLARAIRVFLAAAEASCDDA
jgi:hypothetical protein